VEKDRVIFLVISEEKKKKKNKRRSEAKETLNFWGIDTGEERKARQIQ